MKFVNNLSEEKINFHRISSRRIAGEVLELKLKWSPKEIAWEIPERFAARTLIISEQCSKQIPEENVEILKHLPKEERNC